jgi:hypothetical protein
MTERVIGIMILPSALFLGVTGSLVGAGVWMVIGAVLVAYSNEKKTPPHKAGGVQ